MKFVYIGYDFMLDAVHQLIAQGHELVGVCSFPCDNRFIFNVQTEALCEVMQIDFIVDPLRDVHIKDFVDQGAECFLSAGYPHKIPAMFDDSIEGKKIYALNVHPTLLPLGRSVLPAPHVLLNHPEASGVTIHKLAERLDAGDIIAQEPLPIHEGESVETLSARIVLKARSLLTGIFEDIDKLYQNAVPQDDDKATHWEVPTDVMRTLDWNKPVKQIQKIQRAFGYYGSLAFFNNEAWHVFDADVWEEEHDHNVGDVVANLGAQLVIAASDGFVCLKLIEKLEKN